MNLLELKNKLLKNKSVKKVFEGHDIALEISLKITEARIRAGLTQSELAKKIKTKQSGIARVESGNRLPSLGLLLKLEKALNINIINTSHSENRISSTDIYKIDLGNYFNKLLTSSTINYQSSSTPQSSNYLIQNSI